MNNIKIINLPENTSPSLSGVTIVVDNDITSKITLSDFKNIVGGGGGSTPIDVTYSELYDLVLNSGLTANSTYRLTDYRSLNFLHGRDIAENNATPTVLTSGFTPQEIYTGDTEVLLLTAISNSSLLPIGFSELHPNDIIYYTPIFNHVGMYLELNNGYTLPNSTTLSGFDLQWDNTNSYAYFDIPSGYPVAYEDYFYVYAEFDGNSYDLQSEIYPFVPNNDIVDNNGDVQLTKIVFENNMTRVILSGLSQNDVSLYDVDSLYVEYYYQFANAYCRIFRRQDTVNNVDVPFDFRGIKYRRFEVNLESILNVITSSSMVDYYGNGENLIGQYTFDPTGYTGNYQDFYVFGNNGYTPNNIKWNGDANYYLPDNNVFLGRANNLDINYMYDNTIKLCRDNKIIYMFSNIIDSISDCEINSLSDNVISEFYGNILNFQRYWPDTA